MKAFAKTLAFIGFQSSGKTTLGRLLAHRLQLSFFDTDDLIQQLHPSLSCREIFKTFGNVYFRKLESQIIASLNYDSSFVLATGGGSLLQEMNKFILKKHCTLLYLKTSECILKKRIWQQPNLPGYLNSNQSHETFHQIYQERKVIYEKCADYMIDMDESSPEQSLEFILKHCI